MYCTDIPRVDLEGRLIPSGRLSKVPTSLDYQLLQLLVYPGGPLAGKYLC